MTSAPARVVVAGGSLAGLLTALALAERGIRVTVLERETAPCAEDGLVPRPSGAVPQVVHPHATGPGFVAALRRAAPRAAQEVLTRLEGEGGGLVHLVDLLPSTVADRSVRPGDEELVAPTARRPVLERAVRAVAAATPGVRLLPGGVVEGLDVRRTTPRRVVGVVVRGLGVLPADLVVDATGRRTRAASWLAEHGLPAARVEVDDDCGTVYHSRTFRLHDPSARPAELLRGTFSAAVAPSHLAAVFLGDRGTLQVTLGRLPEDAELAALRHVEAWDAAARCFDLARAWTDPEVAEPLTGVATMAGLRTVVRRPVDSDGSALVPGLLQVGDAAATTNPSFGRGMALAALHAAAVAEAVARHGRDAAAVVEDADAAWQRLVRPHVDDAVARDRVRLALVRPDAVAPPPCAGQLVTWPELMARAPYDADVWRASYRAAAVLAEPQAVLSDPAVAARVRAEGAAVLPAVPSREELAAAVGGVLV